MKAGIIVVVLGAYMFAMGIVGMARTGSLTPIFISGSFASVTVWLGWLVSKGMHRVRGVVLGWLGTMVVLMAYMTFDQVPAHASPSAGSVVIFGSMALLSLAALVMLLKSRPGR